MSVSVKIGNDTVSNVTKFKVESADTAGNYVEFYNESGNQDISTLDEYNVADKETARISSTERAKIIPGNIKSGVTILGVQGSHAGGGSYSVTTTVTNGTSSGATAMPMGEGANVVAKTLITPSSGYYLPANITVNNATYTYDALTGNVLLHTPTNNVTVSATCASTPFLQKGDIILTPFYSNALLNDQSTWSKMLLIDNIQNGKIYVVPLTTSWPLNDQYPSVTECPMVMSVNSFSTQQDSQSWGYDYYYYDNIIASHPYYGVMLDFDSGSLSYHSSFLSALSPTFSTIIQYGYESGSTSGPDLSTATSLVTNNPSFNKVRMLNVGDLANLFAGVPTGNQLGQFFWKGWHPSEYDTPSMFNIYLSDYYTAQWLSDHTSMWAANVGAWEYPDGGYANWMNESIFVDEYNNVPRGFTPVCSLDLSQLTYVKSNQTLSTIMNS